MTTTMEKLKSEREMREINFLRLGASGSFTVRYTYDARKRDHCLRERTSGFKVTIYGREFEEFRRVMDLCAAKGGRQVTIEVSC